MDPEANLAEQLRLSSKIIEAHDNERPVSGYDAARLAELVIALDGWLSGGSYPPARWNRPTPKRQRR